VSDWTWWYAPDAAQVVGGLAADQIAEVDALAQRIEDAVAVRRIGVPFDEQEAASDLKAYGNDRYSSGSRSTTGSMSCWSCGCSTSARPPVPMPGNTAPWLLSIRTPLHRHARLTGARDLRHLCLSTQLACPEWSA